MLTTFYAIIDHILLKLNSLKRYLKLNVGSEAHILLQTVMVYNTIIWIVYLLEFRRRYLRQVFARRHPTLSQEFHSIFGTFNKFDANYLELRRLYRFYLFFLIFVSFTTLLLLYPQTWVVPLSRAFPQLLAYTPSP